MARRGCAKKAPTRLRRVRDSPWAQESSSGYSTSVCRSCCRACSICRRCGASLRSATTSFRAAAQKQILFHVFAREDNGCVCTTECDLQASHRVWQGNARPPRRHAPPLLLARQRGSGWGTGRSGGGRCFGRVPATPPKLDIRVQIWACLHLCLSVSLSHTHTLPHSLSLSASLSLSDSLDADTAACLCHQELEPL